MLIQGIMCPDVIFVHILLSPFGIFSSKGIPLVSVVIRPGYIFSKFFNFLNNRQWTCCIFVALRKKFVFLMYM